MDDVIKKAREVLLKYNSDFLVPFPFQEMSKKLEDVEIFYKDITQDGMSGAIIFDEQSKRFKILVNSAEIVERQHFTMAHEFGHYFLHNEWMRKNNEKAFVDGSESYESVMFRAALVSDEQREMEREANNFAAELLMPEEKIREAWEATGGRRSVEFYADMFAVSVSAMAIRMERLGLRTHRKR